ncbi:hypothetical protein GC105_10595 [Alkalibaculum sp. M08DMB]|uniref:Phage protein n=1 Tax=Alkalibaculum sporogenes TaxID=2655001 RepID=A0A6A7KA20_9FIRM|nr:hypothetical protein [Alkalibaculum sporogenes]MPW26236.1 hypothetical protein [Alkalibaculum sporogenes]
MIKEAIKYIVDLGKTEIFDIGDFKFTNDQLKVICDPQADSLSINTLNGVVDYVNNQVDNESIVTRIVINVLSYKEVHVMSELFGAQQRETYLKAIPCNPNIILDKFMDIESFNIQLQSGFVTTPFIETILKVTGNITDSQVTNFSDDGVSQSVTAKAGIARVGEVVVPNPVILRPYRTFPEIEQPESPFILRMADGPRAALFCADGGAWKLQAIRSIKEYLSEKLEKEIAAEEVIIIA